MSDKIVETTEKSTEALKNKAPTDKINVSPF